MGDFGRSIACVFLTVIPFVCAFGAEWNYYSDNTREMFVLPRAAASAASDIMFTRDGGGESNAGALPFDSANELTLSYAAYYQNSFSTSMLSYAGAIDRMSGFGVSLSYLYNPGIRGTQNLEVGSDGVPVWDPTRFTYSTESILSFHAAYGRALTFGNRFELGLGAALNALRHSLPFGEYRGYGMGLDAGIVLNFPRPGIRLGLQGENVTSLYTKWSASYSEKAYPHVFLGLGWEHDIPYIYGHIRLHYKTLDVLSNQGANSINSSYVFGTGDTTSTSAQSLPVPRDEPDAPKLLSEPGWFLMSGSLGLEYRIMDIVEVRVGHSMFNTWTFGCGIALLKRRLAFDFACLSHELAPTYQLSVTYRH
jgi:hypothetical protein